MHLTDVLDLKAVHVNVCPCGHAPDVLTCMQASNTQLSTGMVEFAMLAANGYKNAATKQTYKRKRNA